MEDQCSPLSWDFYYQQEGYTEEYLKHYLLNTNLELEKTILYTQQELARKDDELMHLKALLIKTLKERDEAQFNCQTLMQDKILLQQQLKTESPVKGGDSNSGFSFSGGYDENATSSTPPVEVVEKRLLPEKGKFLQAVMDAGPLLQTLLLAGKLPEWQHPPPQLNTTGYKFVAKCAGVEHEEGFN